VGGCAVALGGGWVGGTSVGLSVGALVSVAATLVGGTAVASGAFGANTEHASSITAPTIRIRDRLPMLPAF